MVRLVMAVSVVKSVTSIATSVDKTIKPRIGLGVSLGWVDKTRQNYAVD